MMREKTREATEADEQNIANYLETSLAELEPHLCRGGFANIGLRQHQFFDAQRMIARFAREHELNAYLSYRYGGEVDLSYVFIAWVPDPQIPEEVECIAEHVVP